MHSPVEPDPVTAARLLPVLETLRKREPIFHRPEFGRTRADFEPMIAADFFEIGASGQRYSRAHVLDVLEHRAPDPGRPVNGSRPSSSRRASSRHRAGSCAATSRAGVKKKPVRVYTG